MSVCLCILLLFLHLILFCFSLVFWGIFGGGFGLLFFFVFFFMYSMCKSEKQILFVQTNKQFNVSVLLKTLINYALS